MEVGAENSLLDSIEQRRLGVNQSIKQGAWAEALKLALRDAPLASTSAKAKDANAAVVASAALAVREAELAVVVGVLDADEAEVLLKCAPLARPPPNHPAPQSPRVPSETRHLASPPHRQVRVPMPLDAVGQVGALVQVARRAGRANGARRGGASYCRSGTDGLNATFDERASESNHMHLAACSKTVAVGLLPCP
eukprot:CAMPEP_0180103228 /NCGR_PEP_ID=MMETSP0985-20121206/30655_1 /TAXON_ID=483367 /ORGANISM="non described non described, Strain CCMP 2436" /LENGTH=194 /DNA_ID=CAMNT_0022039687 /DNA_START=37 /DNA_END=621 /DNA_ORIENTATION=-